MHSLGKKATTRRTTKEISQKCSAYLEKDYIDFEFKYDEKFFNQQPIS